MICGQKLKRLYYTIIMSLQETVAAHLTGVDGVPALEELQLTTKMHEITRGLHWRHSELFSSASGIVLQEGIGDASISNLGSCPLEDLTEAVLCGAIGDGRKMRRPGNISLAYDGQDENYDMYGWQAIISDRQDRNRQIVRLDVSRLAMTAKILRQNGQGVITRPIEQVDPVPVARLIAGLLASGIVDRTIDQIAARKMALQTSIDKAVFDNHREIVLLRESLRNFEAFTQQKVVESVQAKQMTALQEQQKLLAKVGFMPATIEQF
jgi:hypothetical protein